MAKTKRISWSPSSRRDLFDIYRYFARAASPEIAETLLQEIDAAISKLRSEPLMGTLRPELLPELRVIFIHPYSLFYRPTEETIEIARIVHERREPLSAETLTD
jgi:toxin ParE1/3/4